MTALYERYQRELARLQKMAAIPDYSPEGDAAFLIQYRITKEAYLACSELTLTPQGRAAVAAIREQMQ